MLYRYRPAIRLVGLPKVYGTMCHSQWRHHPNSFCPLPGHDCNSNNGYSSNPRNTFWSLRYVVSASGRFGWTYSGESTLFVFNRPSSIASTYSRLSRLDARWKISIWSQSDTNVMVLFNTLSLSYRILQVIRRCSISSSTKLNIFFKVGKYSKVIKTNSTRLKFLTSHCNAIRTCEFTRDHSFNVWATASFQIPRSYIADLWLIFAAVTLRRRKTNWWRRGTHMYLIDDHKASDWRHSLFTVLIMCFCLTSSRRRRFQVPRPS